jgi:toxin-antitoxin system PIN domain toxin
VRALLDVNMLLALFDAQHLHHDRALAWWTANREHGWASCPLTQNGFLRVISGARYRQPQSFASALELLLAQIARPDHVFWPDDVSVTDPKCFDHSRLLGPNQITGVYLLALAVKNGGRFVTLDQSVAIAAVRKAEPQHLLMI